MDPNDRKWDRAWEWMEVEAARAADVLVGEMLVAVGLNCGKYVRLGGRRHRGEAPEPLEGMDDVLALAFRMIGSSSAMETPERGMRSWRGSSKDGESPPRPDATK